MTELERSHIINLWNSGLDTYDIGQKLKMHESVVYNALASMSNQKTEPYAFPRETAQDGFFGVGGWYR